MVAVSGVAGASAEQLNDPTAIFIHKKTSTLNVADYGNTRIQTFELNNLAKRGKTVASFATNPFKVNVDDDTNGSNIYVSLPLNDRAEKWVNGATRGAQIGGECLSCLGI